MPEHTLFKHMFLRNAEVSQPFAELKTLTLGLFVEQPHEIVDFEFVLFNKLLPFFSQLQRCVAKDDLLSIGPMKFKVMACYPHAGLVSAATQIQCYSALTTQPLSRAHVLPISPSSLDERSFRRKVLPYLLQNTVHLHKEQTLQIADLQLIVVATEPMNGIVTESTELFFDGEPLTEVRVVHVVAHAENLPHPLQRLSQDQLKDAMYHMFLMPFFVGWSRVIQNSQPIDIEGLRVTVQGPQSGLGVITENSRIQCDGSLIERSVPALISNGLRNLLGSRAVEATGDPRADLIQHILFIQQLLSSLEPAESQGTESRVMDQLPVYKLTSIPSSEERKRCLVCMEDYELGVEVKTMPCCKRYAVHVFHTECIDQWLARSRLCPVCKTPSDQVS
jgi:hypothetical protein